jgi:hypothetical protein
MAAWVKRHDVWFAAEQQPWRRSQWIIYAELDLNYFDKFFTTQVLLNAVVGIRILGTRGGTISIPFNKR